MLQHMSGLNCLPEHSDYAFGGEAIATPPGRQLGTAGQVGLFTLFAANPKVSRPKKQFNVWSVDNATIGASRPLCNQVR